MLVKWSTTRSGWPKHIIGLDLLARWGAMVDMSGAKLCLSTETVALPLAEINCWRRGSPHRCCRPEGLSLQSCWPRGPSCCCSQPRGPLHCFRQLTRSPHIAAGGSLPAKGSCCTAASPGLFHGAVACLRVCFANAVSPRVIYTTAVFDS